MTNIREISQDWKITLIGAGNVGFHLGKKLYESRYEIVQVFSRDKKNSEKLAEQIQASPINSLEKLLPSADLYIISVPDDAIETVIKTLSVNKSLKNKLFVHTSGNTPSRVFKSHFSRYGIFYPLQSFSKQKTPDFKRIPICVDASKEEDLQILKSIASSISENLYQLSDAQRSIVHVAAVFANNFTNYLYQISADILEKENLSFDILKPLIEETACKIKEQNPREVQTGPAIRGDVGSIKKHLAYLQNFPEYASIYRMLTFGVNPDIPGLENET